MTAYEFRTEPRAHQRAGLRHLIERKGVGALLHDPGLGKSKTVIDYLAMLTLKHGSQDWMIAAPLSALDGWPDQLAQHLPEEVELRLVWLGDGAGSIETKAQRIRSLATDRGAHGTLRIVLVNHDAFGSKAKARGADGRKLSTVTVWDRIVGAVEEWQPDGIVVDELHRLKTHTSRRSKAFARLARCTPRRIGLTGTVAPRNPLDVYGQWQFIEPRRFGTDWNAFRFTYARWGGFHDKQPVAWLDPDGMHRLLSMDAHVAKKEAALDLPPVTDVTVPVRLSPAERSAYVSMGEEMLVELPSGDEAVAPIPLTKLLRLRQLTGGFVGYEDDDGSRREERLGTAKAEVCTAKLVDLVDAGEKVVVFAHFRSDLDVIAERASKALPKGTPVYRVDGGTAQADRMRQREAFRDLDGPAVFVAQMRTMSLGVNELVVSSYAIFYSLSERRDDYEQARDRLNRIGQQRPVTLYHLVVPDSVDELLLTGHQEKLDLERAITTRADACRFLTLGGDA